MLQDAEEAGLEEAARQAAAAQEASQQQQATRAAEVGLRLYGPMYGLVRICTSWERRRRGKGLRRAVWQRS